MKRGWGWGCCWHHCKRGLSLSPMTGFTGSQIIWFEHRCGRGERLGVFLPNVINRLFPEHVSPSGPFSLQFFFPLRHGRQVMRTWLPTSGSHPQAHFELVTPSPRAEETWSQTPHLSLDPQRYLGVPGNLSQRRVEGRRIQPIAAPS